MFERGEKVLVYGYVVSDENGKLTVEIAGHKVHGTPREPAATATSMTTTEATTDDQETTPIVDFQETTPIVD